MRFSERYGHKKIRDIVQIESIDEPLRTALWNVLQIHIWDSVKMSSGMYVRYYISNDSNRETYNLCKRLWLSYFKKPLDTLDSEWDDARKFLRGYFFKCEWYEVYDFIEFCASNYDRHGFKERFTDSCNKVLEREMSAYRFINGLIVQITEQEQLDDIEKALEESRGPVRTHLRRSLELLSNRESPDYRNSIKESVCAVESLVGIVLGSKGTLGQLIKKLEDEINLHPALKSAFSSLYGYTSDEGGIRHALMESESIRFEDAKFFIVVCSAFINFVESKVSE
ncbi:AbiJ-NTD4 domain-containing protein [Endozoicomonas sp. ALC066]|uniref:AbiJ-NTD4 domain-containing protein n=1 Tax=Endozoicomonas sp. ALC066 TaxID=3403078 RepID=UPI003BB69192